MKTRKLLLPLVMVSLLSSSLIKADNTNSILIEQVAGGNSLDLLIEQIGYNNKIFFSIGDGDDNIINLKQEGNNNELGYANDSPSWGSGVSWGGDLDFDDQNVRLWQNCTQTSCNKNDIQFHVSYGTDNKVWWAQGYEISSRTDTGWSKDNYEGGGHKVTIDIHGNRNEIVGQQRNCSANSCDGHTAQIYIYGDDNSVFGKQKADDSKTFNLTIHNDDNVVDYLQDGHGEHTATIVLTGSYGTDLDISQHSNNNQSYSLSQNCQTSGGCTISVTQQ
jgi:hypothetical protein